MSSFPGCIAYSTTCFRFGNAALLVSSGTCDADVLPRPIRSRKGFGGGTPSMRASVSGTSSSAYVMPESRRCVSRDDTSAGSRARMLLNDMLWSVRT